MKKFNYFILALVSLTSAPLLAEKFLGSITIEPGIDLTFEAAARDKIVPETFYLPENKTDVHIEVLATWSDEAPPGSREGGHVAIAALSPSTCQLSKEIKKETKHPIRHSKHCKTIS